MLQQSIINWEKAVSLAGNKPEFAEEVLTMFMEDLPNLFGEIKSAFDAEDYKKTEYYVHKLNGGCAYVGTERLKATAEEMETQLKKNADISHLNTLFEQLQHDINTLNEVYADGRYK